MNVRLELESLEERAVPSASTMINPVVATVAAQIVPMPPTYQSSHALAGHGNGTYSINTPVTDAGPTCQITGNGNFGRLGAATVSGSIQGVGMIANGRAHGTLTFTSAQGSLTVELTGPVQSAFAAMPTWFRYHVTSATGSYRSLNDSGTLRIDCNPAQVSISGGVSAVRETGTFRIAI
jgi:hypothetical protein